jgi:hypothetical protein
MSGEIPEYRAYCDICNGGSEWFELSVESAKAWRDLHFDDQHPDNPMKKTNCRIQRRMIDVEESFDNPKTQAGIVEALNHE